VTKKRETSKDLEEELLVFKKEVLEKYEKGFYKDVRQARFFTKGLDLDLFDLFKDVMDDELLDE